MRTRTIILTSAATTIAVLAIVVAVLAVASPGVAQTTIASQPPSLADAHLALPDGGGAKIWSILGQDLVDLQHYQKHVSVFGCRYYETGSTYQRASAPVHLPDGATILWFRFYWKDITDAANSEAQLRRYPFVYPNDYDILSTIYSNGTTAVPLESFTEDGDLNILIENSTYIYNVYVDIHYEEDDMRICSIQIGYTVPGIFGSAMPIIQK